jgi:hypothetical protein
MVLGTGAQTHSSNVKNTMLIFVHNQSGCVTDKM